MNETWSLCSNEIVLLTIFFFSETFLDYWQIIVIDHYMTAKKIRAQNLIFYSIAMSYCQIFKGRLQNKIFEAQRFHRWGAWVVTSKLSLPNRDEKLVKRRRLYKNHRNISLERTCGNNWQGFLFWYLVETNGRMVDTRQHLRLPSTKPQPLQSIHAHCCSFIPTHLENLCSSWELRTFRRGLFILEMLRI